jgi:predicted membrane protein
MFALNSILFGALSYIILELVDKIPCIKIAEAESLHVWSNLSTDSAVHFKEVFYASIAAIILAYISAFIENKKIIIKVANCLGVSTKFGEETLYTYFLSADIIQDVYVRDIKNNLTYHGVLNSYSESSTAKEMTLIDARVYRYQDSELLYKIDHLYLCLPIDQVIIESKISQDDRKETVE